jgi:hypothetical protein
MTAAELNPELRNLIDARLEAIDRVLLHVETGWSERRSIVDEVETQIYELLARRSATPSEADVQAVLATLDPPEAYIPHELRERLGDAPSPSAPPPKPQWRRLSPSVVELLSRFVKRAVCASALVVANGLVVAFIVASDGVVPWLITLGGLAWLNYAGIRWFRTWSATRRGRLLDEVRCSLSTWLMPKNGVPAA